jgi:N-acetylglucosaminyldiphosphoundecaprenol N-acetyl-beta-D-mannosaminyltransferase
MTCPIPKKSLLGVHISVTTYTEVVSAVLASALQRQPLTFTALDAHGLRRGARDRGFRDLINQFDIVSPDGHSLKWGLNTLHAQHLADRVAGPDLTMLLCSKASQVGCPIFLYGSHDHVVRGLRDRLCQCFSGLQVAGIQPSRFRPATFEEDQTDLDLISQSGAQLVLVGLGCPLQEQWVFEHTKKLSMPLLAVGAAFDFISGNKPRAPKWMQDAALEWVFRILSEPRRLVRRSLPAVTYVFFALFREWMRRSGGMSGHATSPLLKPPTEIP